MAKKKSKPVKKPKVAKKKPVKKPEPAKRPPGAELLENPLLKDLLHQLAGEHGNTVLKTLVEKELTDDEISKRAGLPINLVRRILYELYEQRVVEYRRTRDEESGWYVYHWRLRPEQAIEHLKEKKLQFLRRLEEKLEEERSTMYFTCRENHEKVPFDLATEFEFKCPVCKGRLETYDNSSTIASIERRVQLLREQLSKL